MVSEAKGSQGPRRCHPAQQSRAVGGPRVAAVDSWAPPERTRAVASLMDPRPVCAAPLPEHAKGLAPAWTWASVSGQTPARERVLLGMTSLGPRRCRCPHSGGRGLPLRRALEAPCWPKPRGGCQDAPVGATSCPVKLLPGRATRLHRTCSSELSHALLSSRPPTETRQNHQIQGGGSGHLYCDYFLKYSY